MERNVDGEDEIFGDPDGSARAGKFKSGSTDDSSYDLKAGADAQSGTTRTKDGGYAAAARAEAGLSASGSKTFDDGPVDVTVQGQADAKAKASASGHAGPSEVEGKVKASVGASASGSAKLGDEDTNVEAGGTVFTGGDGTLGGGFGFDPKNGEIGGTVQGEFLLGNQAQARGSAEIGGVKGSGSVSAINGLAGGGHVNAGLDDGVLTLGFGGKLAFGVGLGFDVNLKIDFNKILGKEKNPFEEVAKALNKLNGGRSEYSGAQLEFYSRAYVGDKPGNMTVKDLLDKLATDGLLSKDANGDAVLGATPSSDSGRHALSTSIITTGSGTDAKSTDAEGLAKGLNFANRGDSETTQKAQAVINIYGDGKTIDEAGLTRAMKEGALSFGEVESVHKGKKETTIGMRLQPDTKNMSPETLGKMLGSADNGKDLAAVINNMNKEYFGSKDVYVGDHQAQVALKGYLAQGLTPEQAATQMVKDGVIVRTPEGGLDFNAFGLMDKVKSEDPAVAADAKKKMASSLLHSGGGNAEDPIDAGGLKKALNMLNRGDADYGPALDSMVKFYGGDDGKLDQAELERMIAEGALATGDMQSKFDGKMETINGMSVKPPNLAGIESGSLSIAISSTAGDDGMEAKELQSWFADGVNVDQLNVLMHGYNGDGKVSQAELKEMLDEGALRVDETGKLSINANLIFIQAHSSDPATSQKYQERLTNMLGTYGRDSDDTSSDYNKGKPERITGGDDFARALNELSGKEVVSKDQIPGMVESFTQFNETDHTNLRENNVRYAVAAGAVSFDPVAGVTLNTAAYK